jgi:hypothetical protein
MLRYELFITISKKCETGLPYQEKWIVVADGLSKAQTVTFPHHPNPPACPKQTPRVDNLFIILTSTSRPHPGTLDELCL